MLVAYCDPDRLEAHMKELSPGDGRVIEDLAEGVRKFTRFDMSALGAKPRPLMTFNDWRRLGQKMTPYLGPLVRWGMASAQSFAKRFKDPFLRQAFPHLFAWPEIPMMAAVSLLGIQKTLPKVQNFYMAGQWVEPGGSVPLVALSGRNAVQMICHNDRKMFVTTLA